RAWGCAGGSRHKPALNVSAPADIQGGDAVADERPSGVSDALSVRTYVRLGSSARADPVGSTAAAEEHRWDVVSGETQAPGGLGSRGGRPHQRGGAALGKGVAVS